MKAITHIFILLLVISAAGMFLDGCVHDPEIITGSPVDTNSNPIDTTDPGTNSNPCNPNIIYFEKQVLPLLISSCAISGCHDPIAKEDGVVLNSFDNVVRTGDIKAFNPGGSKLYRMITETDLKKRMPPPPLNSLNDSQKKLISDWIAQGAKNLTCDAPLTCDTSSMSFSKNILSIINNSCTGCHSGTAPSANIRLTNYSEIRTQANLGKLSCVINWRAGCIRMPSGGNKLESCQIKQIDAWINQGSLNN